MAASTLWTEQGLKRIRWTDDSKMWQHTRQPQAAGHRHFSELFRQRDVLVARSVQQGESFIEGFDILTLGAEDRPLTVGGLPGGFVEESMV